LLDCSDSLGLGSEFVLSKAAAHRVIEEDEPIARVTVYLLVDRDGGLRFWPVKLGDARELPGKPSDYVKSAHKAVEEARQGWVKIIWRSRKGANCWRTRPARIKIPDPAWPEDPRAVFLRTIDDRFIDDPDDKIIRRFLGEE
jgi:hypothetical protein